MPTSPKCIINHFYGMAKVSVVVQLFISAAYGTERERAAEHSAGGGPVGSYIVILARNSKYSRNL